jgi:hypothetical protein
MECHQILPIFLLLPRRQHTSAGNPNHASAVARALGNESAISLDQLRAIAVIDALRCLAKFSSWNSPLHTQCGTHQTGRRAASLVAPSIVRRRDLSSAALRLARPFDAETVSQTDVQDPVWPLSSLEGGPSPIPMQMASTKLYRGPRLGVCQFTLSNARTPIPNAIHC